MCLSKQFKKFIAIFLLAVISTPITSCVALAQEEAGLTKRAFIFKPTSDVDSGINSNAGVIEKLEVTFEDKYRADGTKYKEFLLESIVSGVAAFSGLPYNGDGAVLPDGFSYVGNLGGGKTPQAQQHQLPQFLCKYTGTANSMDCNVVLYSGGKPTDDFGLSQFVASSITGDKKAAFLETFYSIAYEPTRRSAHFRLRIDLDKLFENQNIVSPSMFVPTSEIGVWFHPRTAFYNFSIDQATGRFTHFAAAKVGWYDSGSEIITDYPGGSKCKDSAPLVLDFDELKHGEIVSNQYADYFTVTGQSATGTQYKVVAFDSSNVHPGLVGLATPGVSLGQGKGPDDFPGHGNTTAKKMILVMSDGQDSNGDGILDGAWNPVFTGGTLSFNFKQPTPVRSIVGINAGLDGNDTYKIGNTVIKIADIHYNSVQTLNMDFPDNATEQEKKVSTLVIQYDNPSGFDDLAICLDCLQQDRDACGVCNGPGKDQCNRCPGEPGHGTPAGVCGCNQVPDQCNRCPGDPEFNVPPSKCGCGQVPDECDLCPNDPNYGTGKDACGLCGGNGQDACARCPGEANYGNPDCDPCEQGLPRDECGVCGGPGKDDCGLCPDEKGYNTKNECGICSNDPNFDKPCTDCPEGRDVCGVCGGNNDCCGTQDLTAQQMTIDGTLHFMVNNFNTLRRRYAHRASGSKQKDYIRDASNTVEAAMLSGWTATWGITTLQTFCEGADAACTEVSNESNLQQVVAAADTIKAEAEKMLNKLTKILGRNKPREEDRKIFKALNNHYTTVETNVSNLPKVTQNCNLK